MENDRFQNPVGIGGWLLIPLGMFIMTIGRGLLGLRGLVFHEFEVFDVIAVLFAIWSLLCVYLILKRSPKVRYACANYFLVCVVFGLLNLCLVGVLGLLNLCLVGVTGESGFQIDPLSLVSTVVSTVWSSVWAVYFLKSKRVANTFPGSGTEVLKKRSRDPETEMDVSKLLIRRFAARVTDMAVVLLVMLCIITSQGLFREEDFWFTVICVVGDFFFCGVIVNFVVMDCIVYPLFRRTLGKWLFGLRVVTEEGENLTRRQCMFRSGNRLYYLAWPVLLVTPLAYGAPSVHYSLLHLWLWFLFMVFMVVVRFYDRFTLSS